MINDANYDIVMKAVEEQKVKGEIRQVTQEMNNVVKNLAQKSYNRSWRHAKKQKMNQITFWWVGTKIEVIVRAFVAKLMQRI